MFVFFQTKRELEQLRKLNIHLQELNMQMASKGPLIQEPSVHKATKHPMEPILENVISIFFKFT